MALTEKSARSIFAQAEAMVRIGILPRDPRLPKATRLLGLPTPTTAPTTAVQAFCKGCDRFKYPDSCSVLKRDEQDDVVRTGECLAARAQGQWGFMSQKGFRLN